MRRRQGAGRRLGAALAVCLTAASLWAAVRAEPLPWLSALEATFLDLRFQLRGPIEPSGEVAVVLIDERTVSHLGNWPLPRARLADLLDAIESEAPKVVAIDLLFAEERPEEDRQLGAAIGKLEQSILPFVFVFEADLANRFVAPEAVRRAAYRLVRRPAEGDAHPALAPVGLLAPPEVLAGQAAGMAHATVLLDQGGALRSDEPAIHFGDLVYPSLGVEAARRYLGLSPSEVAAMPPKGIELGGRVVPTDRRGRLPVNYYGPGGTIPTYSAIDLLQGRIGAEALAGKLVFLGASVTGAGDTFVSPFAKNLPGVEHFATVADNLVQERSLLRNAFAENLELAAILGGSLAAGLLAAALPVTGAVVATLALLALWSLGNLLAFAEADLWIGYVLPSVAMLGSALAMGASRAVREQGLRREAERQRRNLARYFSPRVLDRLLEADNPLALDRTQDAAVMFVDIVGFTAIGEALQPSDAIALLREFHRRVERQVFAHEGSLDKYLGDGALACFGIPEPGPKDALNAFGCAAALLQDVGRWNAEREAVGLAPLRIAIGLHYGQVLMGNVGGGRRFEFTVTGDTVNVASRLEALNRKLDSEVAVSAAALEAARRAGPEGELAAFLDGFRSEAAQEIRGRSGAVAVWVCRRPHREAAGGSRPGSGESA